MAISQHLSSEQGLLEIFGETECRHFAEGPSKQQKEQQFLRKRAVKGGLRSNFSNKKSGI